MKIATWNVERLKHRNLLDRIINACEQIQADILVLTETDSHIQLNYPFSFHTPLLFGSQPVNYRSTENRISVFTKYKPVKQYATFDKHTALCIELETEYGNLLVYGTIIGIYGNRETSFSRDLEKQIKDFQRLKADGKSLCICGDYNCSFSDNYYFTKAGRNTILQMFSQNHIRLLTEKTAECIDHIAVSAEFVGVRNIHIEEWNCDKSLSDHKGIAVSF